MRQPLDWHPSPGVTFRPPRSFRSAPPRLEPQPAGFPVGRERRRPLRLRPPRSDDRVADHARELHHHAAAHGPVYARRSCPPAATISFKKLVNGRACYRPLRAVFTVIPISTTGPSRHQRAALGASPARRYSSSGSRTRRARYRPNSVRSGFSNVFGARGTRSSSRGATGSISSSYSPNDTHTAPTASHEGHKVTRTKTDDSLVSLCLYEKGRGSLTFGPVLTTA